MTHCGRRSLLSLAFGAASAQFLTPRWAQAVPELFGQAPPVGFEPDVIVPTLDELLANAPPARGNEPPYRDEVKLARLILSRAPTNATAFNVAQFYYSLSTGLMDDELGANSFTYGTEWPVRANPLIVSFFDATLLRTPNGDITPWCAAFVNSCIEQGLRGRSNSATIGGTRSAAALSFSDWGTGTEKPTQGDIVVFQHKRKAANGHVGFFVTEVENGIYILGGNQMPLRSKLADGTYEARNTGEINVKFMPRDGKDLRLLTFRTHPSLHDAI
ncbi:CHAP domain-containing protein [Rhizobium oryziradicis]|uniref:Peptidase C51 domain-containing protein n=1 Tax=Rhizobium oryziradicis TaxID=1867956 RepID=A0A1Q8ZV10_9HYPH|nr:CHAP domain-containing protein [Rhizobium oryziradicis]OLP45748.1 hypothetical protein BJF95_11530 [Rhizobium oryziradicis]